MHGLKIMLGEGAEVGLEIGEEFLVGVVVDAAAVKMLR